MKGLKISLYAGKKCIILQETIRWYILPKCGHKPRKNNKWDSGNGKLNIGKKAKENFRMTAKRNVKVLVAQQP